MSGCLQSPPLARGDEDSGNPAKHNADIRDHGQDHDEKPDERCEIQAAHIKGGANENAVDQANEKLAAKISDDVAVDLGEDRGDFVFQR